MKRIASLILASMFVVAGVCAATSVSLSSPDGKIVTTVSVGDQLTYTVACDGIVLMKDNPLALTLSSGEVLGVKPSLTGKKVTSVDEDIHPVVPLKFSIVRNHYNQLRLNFKGGWSVEIRAYDDGVATRFILNRKGTVDVMGETFGINLDAPAKLTMQEPRSFHCNYEERYTFANSDEWGAEKKIAELPFYIDTQKNGIKLLVSESDLNDYPCLFIRGNGANSFTSDFPRQPLEFSDNGDRSVRIDKEADYMARISGKRSLP